MRFKEKYLRVQNAFIYDIILNLTVHITLYENNRSDFPKHIIQCMLISHQHNGRTCNLMKKIVN